MYLTKLVIINFRSCQCVALDVLKDEPNILIGINDCGKTSLLKALELLLSEKPQIFFVKDGSKKKDISNSTLDADSFQQLFQSLSIPAIPYTGAEIFVLGKFVVEEPDLESDIISQLKNQSLWALENAVGEGLWYCRSFDLDGRAKSLLLLPDQIGENSHLHAFYHLTAAQLSKQRTEFKLTKDDIENSNGVGRFSNLELVRALYQRTGTVPTWAEWKWEKGIFPSFRYLDWNSSFENILESATEALKELIDDHLVPVKNKAREEAQAAENALNARLEEHRNIIASVLPQVKSLTANIHFDVKEKITDLLITKIGSDDAVHIDLQGDGIKRQIWFALVKAATIDKESVKYKRHIWAFDEPETHLYPTAQRLLFDIIKDVSEGAIQSFISTHSTVFIDKANLNAIKIVHQEENYTVHSECNSVDEIFHSLELRNSDFLFYDKFLVIEGDTEEYLIPALYKIYSGKTLRENNIQLVSLRGASNWIDQKRIFERVLDGFSKPLDHVAYMFDNDQRFELGQVAITDNYFFVGKQDIEDAIPSQVWVRVVKKVTDDKITLNADKIEELKSKIQANQKIPKNEKFLPLLRSLLKETLQTTGIEPDGFLLPGKGKSLATLIIENIMSIDQIPENVLSCFKYLEMPSYDPLQKSQVEQSDAAPLDITNN